MGKFKCILCFSSVSNNKKILLTKKVTENRTLEECIKENFIYSASILSNKKLACITCFTELKNFYDFRKIVDNNYKNPNEIFIKPEPNDALTSPLTVIKECSVVLNRIEAEYGVAVKLDEEFSNNFDEFPEVDYWNDPDNSHSDDEEDIKEATVKSEKPLTKPIKSSNKSKKFPSKITFPPENLEIPENVQPDQKFIEMNGEIYKNPNLKKRSGRPRKSDCDEVDKMIAEKVEVKCYNCEIKLTTFRSVMNHFKDEHPDEFGYLKCWCNSEKKYYRRIRLVEHLEHHENKFITCEICNNGKVFSTSYSLKKHFKIKHLNEELKEDTQVICQICGKTLANPNALKTHLNLHDTREFECYICHATKISFGRMRLHLKYKHYEKEKNPKILCEICSKLVYKSHMKKHQETFHSNLKQKRIKCAQCGYLLLEKSFKKHMERHAGKNIGYCEICEKNFMDLSDHRSRVHSGRVKEGNHKCSYCEKAYRCPQRLRAHTASSHTHDIPFACRVCYRQYKSIDAWRVHEKKYHPEEYKQFLPDYKKSEDVLIREGKVEVASDADFTKIEYF